MHQGSTEHPQIAENRWQARLGDVSRFEPTKSRTDDNYAKGPQGSERRDTPGEYPQTHQVAGAPVEKWF